MNWHLDMTVSLGQIANAIIIATPIIGYGNRVIMILRQIKTKTDLMWTDYEARHPEQAREFAALHLH